jgi:predicted metalloprotease with PDZ domain
VFYAPSIDVLVESPILVGRFHDWSFSTDDVPHRVAYWSAPGWTPFDSTAFVKGLEAVVNQAVTLFGRPPYRDYTFLFQDEAYGALEHLNSVTLGAPSADLARDPNASLEETAHEFFQPGTCCASGPRSTRA